jgi:phthiodiolone/phenolphthiodiolone dimycocerosates ketoreductase
MGTDFSGVHDLVPQTIDKQTALAYAAKVPASLMKEVTFNGTPDEIIDQVAEWRDHGLRYLNVINASPLNPRLRKSVAANAPYLKILPRLKKL